jgi:hypothetical protein
MAQAQRKLRDHPLRRNARDLVLIELAESQVAIRPEPNAIGIRVRNDEGHGLIHTRQPPDPAG